mmetsp:Transcript_73176/g.194416  ORF Transcript_73176/g.194416 Transcript_73176/m.194416 type:complete len:245 (-) Transcript_73176:72-806(-)
MGGRVFDAHGRRSHGRRCLRHREQAAPVQVHGSEGLLQGLLGPVARRRGPELRPPQPGVPGRHLRQGRDRRAGDHLLQLPRVRGQARPLRDDRLPGHLLRLRRPRGGLPAARLRLRHRHPGRVPRPGRAAGPRRRGGPRLPGAGGVQPAAQRGRRRLPQRRVQEGPVPRRPGLRPAGARELGGRRQEGPAQRRGERRPPGDARRHELPLEGVPLQGRDDRGEAPVRLRHLGGRLGDAPDCLVSW